jgi:2,3-bisphosphoglycerate-dependent phosphoglycerate mutase
LPETSKLEGFRDSTLLVSGAKPFVIPHYNDSSYTILFCVRHAEKVLDGSKNPPLTPEGEARAARLGALFSKTRIDRIGTSNTKRNLQTTEAVKAVADETALEVFAPELVYEWVQDLLITNPGQHVLYVGHSNTIPELLNRLTAGAGYSDIPDHDYGRLYVVATRGLGESEVWEFRY